MSASYESSDRHSSPRHHFGEGLFLFVFLPEAEHDRRAGEVERVAHVSFQVAFVAPVQKLQVAAKDNEPRRTLVGLDHVTEFWKSVFESGWRVFGDAGLQDFVELGGFKTLFAAFFDIPREVK